MSIPQYKTNKPSETDYAYDAKVVYCKAKLKDKYNQMDIKHFADNFEKILRDIDFEWCHKCKDGTLRIPSYKQIVNNWFKQHEWEQCSKNYIHPKLKIQKEEAELIYDKSYLPDTISDYQELDDYRELLKKELKKEEPDTKELERLANLIDKTLVRIEKRLNKNVQKFEGNIKSENLNVEVKSTEEVLKEHEDSISRFISRRLKKTD